MLDGNKDGQKLESMKRIIGVSGRNSEAKARSRDASLDDRQRPKRLRSVPGRREERRVEKSRSKNARACMQIDQIGIFCSIRSRNSFTFT